MRSACHLSVDLTHNPCRQRRSSYTPWHTPLPVSSLSLALSYPPRLVARSASTSTCGALPTPLNSCPQSAGAHTSTTGVKTSFYLQFIGPLSVVFHPSMIRRYPSGGSISLECWSQRCFVCRATIDKNRQLDPAVVGANNLKTLNCYLGTSD